jgi:hypothetical protein
LHLCTPYSSVEQDEVFVAVARGDSKEKNEFASSAMNLDSQTLVTNHSDDDRSTRSGMDLDKEGLFFRHLCALFRKRSASFKRDKRAWLCTTILPGLFVLFGFIVASLTTLEKNMDPVLLTLSDYNPDAHSPRNPIVFNSPNSSYTCQPDLCAYQYPVMNSSVTNVTNELYYFCGYQARLDERANCSITESAEILEELKSADAAPQNASVETLYEVSLDTPLPPSLCRLGLTLVFRTLVINELV